ncbi:hypothetical protein M422DRAFT_174012 [Sphaerobolus stellatus SS14]|uniref:NAD(P)-binding protein n=1 Tax=Sphaerobolus stellatus (strain SS14) TaxID=990650 RepID=A0A0C9VQQ5_SPHS4|nr:hypothetical protein M422DRAFT_174012 [Sphaerobolus stellatus SS14]
MYTWLITGSSRGIGLEFVRQILAGGDRVFATARNPDKSPELQEIAAAAEPGHVHLVQLDTRDAESIKAAAKKVEELLNGDGLDYLLNNAARVSGGNDSPTTIDPDNFMDFMRVNILGPALVFQAFVPALDRSKRPEGPVVMNTTSGLGSIGLDCGVKNASYSISKCGLQMLTYKESKEKPNIICFVLDPGWVKTEMGGEGAFLEIPFSVSHQYKVITSATQKDNGGFKRYDGENLPW